MSTLKLHVDLTGHFVTFSKIEHTTNYGHFWIKLETHST